MKKYFTIAILALLVYCAKQKTETPKPVSYSSAETLQQPIEPQAEDARKWLIKNIEEFFNGENQDMQSITTPEYFEYKTDATNVDLDTPGSLTEKQFHHKWKDQFDTSKAGIGVGFLISAQDWSKIIVSDCRLISETKNEYYFAVKMNDKEMKQNYSALVKVISAQHSFSIADVQMDED